MSRTLWLNYETKPVVKSYNLKTKLAFKLSAYIQNLYRDKNKKKNG